MSVALKRNFFNLFETEYAQYPQLQNSSISW